MKEKRRTKANRGITLIALVITIIVMLILVGVTISIAVNGGLFEYAGKAVGDTKNSVNKEQELASGRIKVGQTWYNNIDDYINNTPSSEQEYKNFTITPENRAKIGYTDEIEELIIPATFQDEDGTWYKVTSIGKSAFDCCENLIRVVIPDSVTSIGDYAFNSCYNLEKVIWHDNLTSIGDSAFCFCNKLTIDSLPANLLSIGEEAFGYNVNLIEDLVIPEGVTEIPRYAFWETGIKSVELHPNLKTIADQAFYFTCLEEIIIPSTIETIGYDAFDGPNLERIIFEEGVEKIDSQVFVVYDMNEAISLYFPKSLKIIDAEAFAETSINKIYYAGTEEQWSEITFGEDWIDSSLEYTIEYNYVDSSN